MADEPVIDLEILPDGTVRFEIDGVAGEDCEALERLVLEALGGEVVSRERTRAFYARTGAKAGVAQRLRSLLKRG